MPRDEATVDRIFAGNLDNLPPLSSKVNIFLSILEKKDLKCFNSSVVADLFGKFKTYS